MENIWKKLWQSKLLCFICDLLNIQKCILRSVHSLGWLLWLYFYSFVKIIDSLGFFCNESKLATTIVNKKGIISLLKWEESSKGVYIKEFNMGFQYILHLRKVKRLCVKDLWSYMKKNCPKKGKISVIKSKTLYFFLCDHCGVKGHVIWPCLSTSSTTTTNWSKCWK
jgi:hypothetical protein